MDVPSLDLTWITPELAIGGRVAPCHVEALASAHQVAAVVDVRAEDRDDPRQLAARGLAFLHLPTLDHAPLTPAALRVGVAFVAAHHAQRRRVLVHCEHGIGRSALLGLCVLVDGGHEPLAALTLAKQRRARVSPSPAQFEAWAGWLRGRGAPAPSFEAFAAIAYHAPTPAEAR